MGDGGLGAVQDGVVETPAGGLRGVLADGIYSFKGVPYGEPTGGECRFLSPVKAAPWSGRRDALEFGPDAPQAAGATPPSAWPKR